MTCRIASARRFDGPSTLSSSMNSTPPASNPPTSIGNATRYRLMPHAFITMSSLFFVSRPIVTSVASSTDSGRM